MNERLVFRFLVWLFLASASAWLLSAFEKSVGIAEAVVSDPGFPGRYTGFFGLVVVIAGVIALAAVVISMSVSYRGAGLFRQESGSIRDELKDIREHVGMGGEAG